MDWGNNLKEPVSLIRSDSTLADIAFTEVFASLARAFNSGNRLYNIKMPAMKATFTHGVL